MSHTQYTSCLYAIVLLNACALEEIPLDELSDNSYEIVGGDDASIDDFPWQVSLQTQSGAPFCGGSILDARWILTAAHCVDNATPTDIRIAAGMTRISDSDTLGQVRDLAKIEIYPGYVSASQGKDIALLRLAAPLDLSSTSVSPIEIVTANDESLGLTAPGTGATVTGWGRLQSGGATPDILQSVTVPLISNSDADALYTNHVITDDMLAAGVVGTGGQDACQGDSGGPIVVDGSLGPKLAGVVSWGIGCALGQYPGLYARVSSFEQFISNRGRIKETFSGSLASGEMIQIGSFDAIPGSPVIVTMTGSGDPDLYVRFGAEPTTSAYDCRPYQSGASETCQLSATDTVYVAVRGYTAANYNISVHYVGDRPQCQAAFDDAWASLGHGSNPDDFYASHGLGFDNSAGYGAIGGMGNNDPGNWDIHGTMGTAAWGLWPGAHSITFDNADAYDVKVDFLRGHYDSTFTVDSMLDGAVVESAVVNLSGAFDAETVEFAGPIDAVAWNQSGYIGVDNLRYRSTDSTCLPSAVTTQISCIAWFDDAWTSLGHGSDPDDFYASYGLGFVSSSGYGVIGGEGNGDPGNWNIDGSEGTAAWGIWSGTHEITFLSADAHSVAIDFLRAHQDLTFTVYAYRGANQVGSTTVSLNGAYDVEAVQFAGPIDRVTWNVNGAMGVDNIRYVQQGGTCPPPMP